MKLRTLLNVSLLFFALCLLDTTDAQAITKKKIRIKNDGSAAVLVMMDEDREIKLIYPGKEETFHNAKVGDKPTFHIFMDQKEIYSRDLRALKNPFGTKRLIWNGQELVDD
jgi:hypothetical protein